MNNIHEKIKAYRKQLHLSQMYVANYLGVSKSTYSQMEKGNRTMTAEEITKLSALFGVSDDKLLNAQEMSATALIFANKFDQLNETDQKEIMRLIEFVEQLNQRKAKNK